MGSKMNNYRPQGPQEWVLVYVIHSPFIYVQKLVINRQNFNDHRRTRTCNLLVPIDGKHSAVEAKRATIAPGSRVMLGKYI